MPATPAQFSSLEISRQTRLLPVTQIAAKLSTGPGFVVAYAGDIMTMPGLPKQPAAEAMDVDPEGNTVGLF